MLQYEGLIAFVKIAFDINCHSAKTVWGSPSPYVQGIGIYYMGSEPHLAKGPTASLQRFRMNRTPPPRDVTVRPDLFWKRE